MGDRRSGRSGNAHRANRLLLDCLGKVQQALLVRVTTAGSSDPRRDVICALEQQNHNDDEED